MNNIIAGHHGGHVHHGAYAHAPGPVHHGTPQHGHATAASVVAGTTPGAIPQQPPNGTAAPYTGYVQHGHAQHQHHGGGQNQHYYGHHGHAGRQHHSHGHGHGHYHHRLHHHNFPPMPPSSAAVAASTPTGTVPTNSGATPAVTGATPGAPTVPLVAAPLSEVDQRIAKIATGCDPQNTGRVTAGTLASVLRITLPEGDHGNILYLLPTHLLFSQYFSFHSRRSYSVCHLIDADAIAAKLVEKGSMSSVSAFPIAGLKVIIKNAVEDEGTGKLALLEQYITMGAIDL
jgi:hypothetical protein